MDSYRETLSKAREKRSLIQSNIPGSKENTSKWIPSILKTPKIIQSYASARNFIVDHADKDLSSERWVTWEDTISRKEFRTPPPPQQDENKHPFFKSASDPSQFQSPKPSSIIQHEVSESKPSFGDEFKFREENNGQQSQSSYASFQEKPRTQIEQPKVHHQNVHPKNPKPQIERPITYSESSHSTYDTKPSTKKAPIREPPPKPPPVLESSPALCLQGWAAPFQDPPQT